MQVWRNKNTYTIIFFFLIGFSIFIIHTVNEETVDFIANFMDVLLPFFGLLAIFIIQRTKKITLQKKVLICFLFLLSLFSKETGVLSLAVVGIYIFFFHIGQLKAY